MSACNHFWRLCGRFCYGNGRILAPTRNQFIANLMFRWIISYHAFQLNEHSNNFLCRKVLRIFCVILSKNIQQSHTSFSRHRCKIFLMIVVNFAIFLQFRSILNISCKSASFISGIPFQINVSWSTVCI